MVKKDTKKIDIKEIKNLRSLINLLKNITTQSHINSETNPPSVFVKIVLKLYPTHLRLLHICSQNQIID